MAWPPPPRHIDTSAHRSNRHSLVFAANQQRRATTFVDDEDRTDLVLVALEQLDEAGLQKVYTVLKRHHDAQKKATKAA